MVLQSTKKRLAVWALVISALLMIPLVAMQFTNEVNWDVSDFAIMGSVLIAIAMIYELVAR
ncbi:MAG: hypothetical protein KJP09_02445, partial [Bacteroidia bacterium]|nr:hypothetical protein [Bacteroidia bacterium]NNK27286.1 hypothetical protein [Flavobacteriaceae bacterium]